MVHLGWPILCGPFKSTKKYWATRKIDGKFRYTQKAEQEATMSDVIPTPADLASSI